MMRAARLCLAGAALTVLFPCVFGVKDGRIHAPVISALAVSLGLLLFLTYDLNHPFQGDIHVEPEGFHQLLSDFGPEPDALNLQG